MVDFDPRSLAEFIRKVHNDNKVMSKYAMGCAHLVMNAVHGPDGGRAILDEIKSLGISIATENQTNYFSEN